jgi:hypothetical protein
LATRWQRALTCHPSGPGPMRCLPTVSPVPRTSSLPAASRRRWQSMALQPCVSTLRGSDPARVSLPTPTSPPMFKTSLPPLTGYARRMPRRHCLSGTALAVLQFLQQRAMCRKRAWWQPLVPRLTRNTWCRIFLPTSIRSSKPGRLKSLLPGGPSPSASSSWTMCARSN